MQFPNHLLNDAVAAFFHVAGVRGKASHGSQNNELRRFFRIPSV